MAALGHVQRLLCSTAGGVLPTTAGQQRRLQPPAFSPCLVPLWTLFQLPPWACQTRRGRAPAAPPSSRLSTRLPSICCAACRVSIGRGGAPRGRHWGCSTTKGCRGTVHVLPSRRGCNARRTCSCAACRACEESWKPSACHSPLLLFPPPSPSPPTRSPPLPPPAPFLSGVTEGNYRALMREAGSLAGLADLSLATLTAVVGGQTAARKLKEFLSQECRALFAAL